MDIVRARLAHLTSIPAVSGACWGQIRATLQANGLLPHSCKSVPSKEIFASTEWILAGQELDQCRLARAIVPDQADNSPCWQTYCQWFEQNEFRQAKLARSNSKREYPRDGSRSAVFGYLNQGCYLILEPGALSAPRADPAESMAPR